MRVTFDGQLREGVYAKDMILALIGQIGAQGGSATRPSSRERLSAACRSKDG